MSKTAESVDGPDNRTVLEYDVDVDLLLRNAREVDVAGEREAETESWERGKSNAPSAAVDSRAPLGVHVVQLPDGQPHGTLLVEAGGEENGLYAGACDCDGFLKHKKPCAHLVARAVRSILRSGEVPVDIERFRTLKEKGERDADQDDVDQNDVQEESTDAEALSDVDGLEDVDTSTRVRQQGKAVRAVQEEQRRDEDAVDVPAQVVDEAPATIDGDPFAAELRENIPERYVMQLGGDPYIRRAGYAAIARQADLRLSVDDVVPAEETGFEHARYVATVRDQDGEVLANDFGTAHLEHEDLAGAEAQLDELAATRACRRAIEWATGAGATLRRDA